MKTPEELIKKQSQEELVIDAKLNINHYNGKNYLQLLVERLDTRFNSLIN